ncbi:hypothetical protein Tco_0589441, partial [Tanacetum coccineum]
RFPFFCNPLPSSSQLVKHFLLIAATASALPISTFLPLPSFPRLPTTTFLPLPTSNEPSPQGDNPVMR